MEAATDPNNTNTFPYRLPLHIYKTILLFISNFVPLLPALEEIGIMYLPQMWFRMKFRVPSRCCFSLRSP